MLLDLGSLPGVGPGEGGGGQESPRRMLRVSLAVRGEARRRPLGGAVPQAEEPGSCTRSELG